MLGPTTKVNFYNGQKYMVGMKIMFRVNGNIMSLVIDGAMGSITVGIEVQNGQQPS